MSAELHAMVGAYALDALDERERRAFESHLAGCPTCLAELAEFRATAARLADTTTAAPPHGMRERLLALIGRTAQERPTVLPLRPRRAAWRRVQVLAAVAATALVVGTFGAYVHEHGQLEQLREQDGREAAVLAAADAMTSSAQAGSGGRLTVVRSDQMGDAIVVMDAMPSLRSERSYQLWSIVRGVPQSLGVYDGADVAGGTSSDLVGDLSGARAVALTIEPEGGSPKPTTQPVASVRLG